MDRCVLFILIILVIVKNIMRKREIERERDMDLDGGRVRSKRKKLLRKGKKFFIDGYRNFFRT